MVNDHTNEVFEVTLRIKSWINWGSGRQNIGLWKADLQNNSVMRRIKHVEEKFKCMLIQGQVSDKVHFLLL